MSRIIHCCVSVRGLLSRNASYLKSWLPYITDDAGNRYANVDALRNALFDELAKGHEVLPGSKDCDSFDFKTGCLGHEVPETQAAEAAQ